ncbi:MAG TPA: arylsulfotransferase family protein [Solirubrobacteraceae bacterium]|nr:arylsulfotransferase family protein [Solirubrobacteraceae bacterium]
MTRAIVPLAALAAVLGLCGCGSASPAGPVSGAIGVDAPAAFPANPVAVSPQPGTPDASPETQISFLGAAGTSVIGVRVVGSHSGVHAGVLRAYSTGTGESFLPARPFTPGERVRVSATVEVGGARRAASTSFTIAHEAPVSPKEFPINPGDPRAVQHYSTAPALTPSTVTITTPAKPGAAPGYLLMAPYQGVGSPGPMIAEQNGGLVWFHPLPAGWEATNLQVQTYEGKPVLTWWQGRILEVGFGQGEDEIYNSDYQHVATVRAGNGYHADLHEIRLTSEGTAWIDAFDPIYANLSRAHGAADGVLTDSVIQEIDVKTGLVMWEWHALGHIPIAESHNPPPTSSYPWDYVHINSISPGSQSNGQEGNVLLSSRNTWTLYDVNIRSGAVLWRLGGEHSSFKLGPGTHTYWQHDAELHAGGLISVFDNGSDPPKEKQSRGLILDPNPKTRTVTLVKQFTNPTKTLLASSQGDMLGLPGGDWLMGYGGLPNFTEYDAAGQVLLDGTLGKSVQDFRTYLSPWSGQPTTPPSVVAAPGAGGTLAVSVSWNGATEVASWRVLAGASPSALAPAASAAKAGFQTTIAVPGAGPYVQVQALDSAGGVIGTSATVEG